MSALLVGVLVTHLQNIVGVCRSALETQGSVARREALEETRSRSRTECGWLTSAAAHHISAGARARPRWVVGTARTHEGSLTRPSTLLSNTSILCAYTYTHTHTHTHSHRARLPDTPRRSCLCLSSPPYTLLFLPVSRFPSHIARACPIPSRLRRPGPSLQPASSTASFALLFFAPLHADHRAPPLPTPTLSVGALNPSFCQLQCVRDDGRAVSRSRHTKLAVDAAPLFVTSSSSPFVSPELFAQTPC